MEKNVPTILKSELQTYQLLGKQYVIRDFSTVNERLNIQSDLTPAVGDTTQMKYIIIGDGGLAVQTGADGIPYTTSYYHKPTDTGLFRQIPFVLRPVASDLDDNTRANYRLRRLESYNNQQYFAYYAKLLPSVDDMIVTLQKRTILNNGSYQIDPFTPGNDDLNPSPTILAVNQPVTTVGTYAAASTLVDFILTADDVTELINVASIIYGSNDRAVISEIALCSGIDRTVSSNDAGVAATYSEVIVAQIMNFLATNFPASNWRNGIKYTFDIGNTEPLYEVSA